MTAAELHSEGRQPASGEGQPMTVMSGAEVRCARERLGLSTNVFAQLVGCSVNTLQKWETARYPVPDGTMKDIEQITKRWQAHAQSVYANIGPDKLLITYQIDDDVYYDEGGEEKGGWGSRWHRAICWWIKENLDSEVKIVYEGEEGVHSLPYDAFFDQKVGGRRRFLTVYEGLKRAGLTPSVPPREE